MEYCIQLGKSELPTKLISLGNAFLVSLSEQKKLCNLKVFLKKKESNTIIHTMVRIRIKGISDYHL